jgi:solute:Na+ symporter, SSS family
MNVITIISFIAVTTIVAIISWYKTRKQKLDSSASFFFANRNLGFIAVGGALFFTNISAANFIGENESVYTNNMSVMAWGMTSVFAMIIVSEFIMPIYLKGGISTTPDFLGDRYDASVKRLVSVIFLISYLFNMLPSVLYSGAVAFNGLFNFSEIFNIDYWQTIWVLVWIMGGLGCVYSIFGGIKAIAISDVVLGICMFAAGLLLPYFGLKYLGNGNVNEGLKIILTTKTEHLNSIGSSKDAVPFSTIFTGMILVNLYYWGTEQYIVQQALSSKNLAESQKGIALACVGKIISPLLLNIPAIIAVHLYANTKNTAEIFPALIRDVSPPLLTGFLASIIFGAALTSFAPGLNSASTLFILNLYKPWAEKKQKIITEKGIMKIAKRFEIIACLTAMFIAPLIMLYKKGLFSYLQVVGGSFSVPIFTILFVGFITKHVPPVAAKIGLLFFMSSYVFTQFFYDGGLHFLHILAILFIITVFLMLVIGKLYPMPVPYVQKMNNLVDLKPWKKRHFYSIILLAMMILMFIIFSPLVLAK